MRSLISGELLRAYFGDLDFWNGEMKLRSVRCRNRAKSLKHVNLCTLCLTHLHVLGTQTILEEAEAAWHHKTASSSLLVTDARKSKANLFTGRLAAWH